MPEAAPQRQRDAGLRDQMRHPLSHAPAGARAGGRRAFDGEYVLAPERRHHVLGEPAQLLLELLRTEALGPVDHEAVEARIFRLDRLDALNHFVRRAAEPGLLRDAVLQGRHLRRRAGRTPGPPLLIRVSYK